MQEAIVAIIVASAAWVVAKRYLPKAMRQALRMSILGAARRLGLSGIARRLEGQTQAAPACTCSACGGCAGVATAPAAKQFAIKLETLKRTASR